MIDLQKDQFEASVLKATQPVLVYITATWCGPCKILRPIMEEVDTEVAGKATIVKVDSDVDHELTRQLKVRGVPTIIAFKDGVEVGRQVGLAPKETLLALLGL